MLIKDLDAVYALEVTHFPNPWPRAFFAADLRARNTVAYVIENENKIIGYVMATCTKEKLHVTNIAVDSSHQRRGVATRLMDKLEQEAKKQRCTNTYLEVRTNNDPAIMLYKRRGYRIVKRRSHYYIDGDDAYVMEKEL